MENLTRKLSAIEYVIFRLTKLMQDSWDILRRDGLRSAMCHSLALVARLLYRPEIEYSVLTRSLLDPLPHIEPSVPVTLRLATPDDLERFQEIAPPSDVALFARYLARGRSCCLALHDDKIVAYCWGGAEVDVYLDDLKMRLQSGDVYFSAGYTVPAYRRRGLLTAVYFYLFQHFRGKGYRRAVTIVSVDNLASQGLVRKVGYQAVDQMFARRILWLRQYRYRSGAF